jgi:murein DD-endopeptidase MepM/ murein hydrolase activator NlpD
VILALALAALAVSIMTSNPAIQPVNSKVQIADFGIASPKEDVRVSTVMSGSIHQNGSLLAELLTLKVPHHTVSRIISRLSKIFDLRQSLAGDEFKVYMSDRDSVLAFEYFTGAQKKYRLEKVGGDFIDEVWDGDTQKRVEFAKAVVETDLWDALVQILPDPDMFIKIAQIYAGQIDLFTDTKKGDTLKVVFEAYYKNDNFVKYGDILALEYVLAGVPYKAFQFTDPEGYTDYFDENGYSLRRAMLKSPLDYRCITSRFSFRRLHPILKVYRPHLGVDYAAARGTPVVAAGNGVIEYKGRLSGFGNYLEILHDFGLTTSYGHLRGFASGIEVGRRVMQGQIIGYVGSTGEATGPHLDYRVKKNGNYINPLKMTMPASPPVKAEYYIEFKNVVAGRMEIINGAADSKVYVLN